VRSLEELPEAIESASREAGSAFGDDTVFCERYVETGRHVEVQVMSDRHGTTWALGERECSVQRRHQKVLEEAPSPLVERIGPRLREQMLSAARTAAQTIGYEGAGTVEFLADHDGSFFFLEMNTRLQVEHPVTENTTGIDLVGLQIDVANGIPLEGPEPTLHGHSIEVRLYAEDASADWRPQSGTVHGFEIPEVRAEFDPLTERGVRLDSGVVAGSVVSTQYDPMLAKIISTAPTREEAARILASALQRSRIHGLVTNRDLLVGILREPDFLGGEFDTGYFASHPPAELAASSAGDARVAVIAAALADAAYDRACSSLPSGIQAGFRNVPAGFRSREYVVDGETHGVSYRWGRHGVEVDGAGDLQVVEVSPQLVVLEIDGVMRRLAVTRCGPVSVAVDSVDGAVELERVPRFVDPADAVAAGSLVAPMPGSVVRVAVEEGDTVEAGQSLLWLEAMKMEHVVRATEGGVVRQVDVSVGQQVEPGTVLAVVASEDEGE